MKKLTKEVRIQQERATLSLLDKNAEKEHKFSYHDLEFVIYKNVVSPYYFNRWRTFTSKLIELTKSGEEFLEIGSGTGITSLLLAKEGLNVTAVDISPLAVENTLVNAKNNNIELANVFLSDVYSGFCSKNKFDVIYWNPPWMETIEKIKIEDCLEYGLFDNGYKSIEQWITESKNYLKPNGRLYIGHADFGNFEKLEQLLDIHNYEYRIVVRESSVEVRDVEFFMYEAKLKEKPNKLFIAMPFTGNSYDDIVKKRLYYHDKAREYNLEILEQFIDIEEKDKFEKSLYHPDFIVKKDINLIDKSDIMLVDLSRVSIGATFEISYARLKRKIPVIGFGLKYDFDKKHPWYNFYCTQIVDTLEDALLIAQQYSQ